jgi:hypothetical protein
MSRKSRPEPLRRGKPSYPPGSVYYSEEMGCRVRIDEYGEETPWEPGSYDMFREPAAPQLPAVPRRADGSISPFYDLTQDELERLRQPNMHHDARRARHDGWTIERQKEFIETLAATASVSDACRYVGLSRQSAHKLYQRSPQFRAAWDDALKASVNVLAATAFDRAVNGTQEQVWHEGRMVGFKEKHHDRLLLYLLRVRDPLNYAPLDDLAGWQRHRALEQRPAGIAPVIDRLEDAERAWAGAEQEPRQLAAPADRLAENIAQTSFIPSREAEALGVTGREAPAAPAWARGETMSTVSTSSTSSGAEGCPEPPSTVSTSSTSGVPPP